MGKFSVTQIIRMLGREYETAVESLFEERHWGETVDMAVFLPEWTELVEEGTRMMVEIENMQ